MDEFRDEIDIIQKLDSKRDAYIEALREAHSTLSDIIRAHYVVAKTTRAKPRPLLEYSEDSEERDRVEDRRITPPFPYRKEFCVDESLPPRLFDEESLTERIAFISVHLSEDLLHANLQSPGDWRAELASESSRYGSSGPCCQVWDVGFDGELSPDELDPHKKIPPFKSIWDQLRQSPQTQPEIAGRIVVVRDLNPILLTALNHTMEETFDFAALLHFLEIASRPHSCEHTGFHDTGDDYRKYIFPLTYLGEDGATMTPASTTVVAEYPRLERRTSNVILYLHSTMTNNFCNAFSPWQMLIIQVGNGDDHFRTTCRLGHGRFTCGPVAFLEILLEEIGTAIEVSQTLFHKVSDFVTPPQACIFNPRLIDPHLLADDDLNMARRCFWASTTLDAIGNDLVSIRGSYDHLFTPAAWEGKHEKFWKLFDPQSARGEMYLDMLARLRGSFETEIARIAALIRRIDERRKDIVAQESRRSTLASEIAAKQSSIAISQGRNIRILTTVSIFFLPLTYVTSVFGMTNMDPNQDFKMFGVATAAICVPFFILMASLNSKRGFAFWERNFKAMLRKIENSCSRLWAIFGGSGESREAGTGQKSDSKGTKVPEVEPEAVLGAARDDTAQSKDNRKIHGVRSRLFGLRSRCKRDTGAEQMV